MLQRVHNQPNRVASMRNTDLEAMLRQYDDLFLQGRLGNYFRNHPDEAFWIEFGRTTEKSGYCRIERHPRCVRVISLSRPVHSRIFTGSTAHTTETNAGLQCTSQLGCLQLTLEHELIHLIIDIWCPEQIGRAIHGNLFKILARNLFGHRDFRHVLGRGLAEDPAVHIARVKQYLHPGMIADVYNRRTRSSTNYEVLEINPRANVKTFLGRAANGRDYRIPLVNVILPGEHPNDGENEEGPDE